MNALEIALAALAIALGLRLVYHAVHMRALRRWLREPALDRLPRGRGVWEDLLADLHRYLRRAWMLDQLFGSSAVLTKKLGQDLLASRELPPLLPL